MANNSGFWLTLQQLTELLGTVTMVPMGNWNATTSYRKLNIVKYNGAAYIAKKQNTGFRPTVTQGWQEVWMKITDKGDQGIQGEKGDTFYIFNNDDVNDIGNVETDLQVTDFTPNFAAASLKNGDVYYGISKSGALVKIEPHFDEDTFTHLSAEVLGYVNLKNGGTVYGDIDLDGNALLTVGSLELGGKTITAVDEKLSATSVNPVKNEAITAEVNRLTNENLLQSYQIADLKRIVYDTVISDEDYTFENLTIANHPTYIADDSGNYHTVLPDGESMLMEVSGKSIKSENLIKNTLTTVTKDGITATVNSDSSVTLNGTATEATHFYIGEVVLNAGTYYIPIKNKSDYIDVWLGSAQSSNDILNIVLNVDRLTFTLTDTTRVYFDYVLVNGQTYDNFTVYPFITNNTNAVAEDYKPYFDGLKSTSYQALQVNRANLWQFIDSGIVTAFKNITSIDKNSFIVQGGILEDVGYSIYAPILPAGTYTLYTNATKCGFNKIGVLHENIDYAASNFPYTFTLSKKQKVVFTLIGYANGQYPSTPTRVFFNLYKGDTVSSTFDEYQPPTTIALLLESIELKGAGSISDKLKVRDKGNGVYQLVKVQNIDEVDLGSLNWNLQNTTTNNWRFFARFSKVKLNKSSKTIPNILCAKYEATTPEKIWTYTAVGISTGNTSPDVIVGDKSYNNALEFKNAMSGVMLYYELATPVETALADNLTELDVATLIQKNGSIQVVGNTEEEFVQPNVTMLYQVEKAIES